MKHALFLSLAVLLGGCRAETRAAAPAEGAPATAVERRWQPLTEWRFTGSDTLVGAEAPGFADAGWRAVTVPHTWTQEQPKTFRAAWYRTHVATGAAEAGRPAYLVFEGAAVRADVYVNGTHLGRHLGAYTRFAFDASAALKAGDNVVAVRISNDPRDTVESLPSSIGKQLYRNYGGLYRKAWLLRTAPQAVDPLDDAAPGVYATTTRVSADSAHLSVRVRLRNAGTEARAIAVRHRLLDRDGREVEILEGRTDVPAGAVREATSEATVARPQLWGPGHPHLYTLRTEVVVDGALTDVVEQRIGFRDFAFKDGRFLLNGAPILLRGVGKHQETEVHASAMTDDEIREDFDNLADLGVNFVRLAHYPHAALAYDLADEKGILVWAENGHSNGTKGGEDGDRITREMVRQNYDHPSIVMWSVGNEAAFVRTMRYARVVKENDPQRLVAYATNVEPNPKQGKGLDLVARNTYRGWYAGQAWELEEKGPKWRYIAENGGGAVISTHTDYADAAHTVDKLEPEEYRQSLAEAQFQVVFRTRAEQIPLYSLWILRDFSIDKYKGRNTKGLLTYANFKKDVWYLYRAFLRPDEPLLHVTSATYFLRRGRAENGVKVYANAKEVRLRVNGEDEGVRRNGEYRQPAGGGRAGRAVDNVFHWPVRLREGRNAIEASDGAGHTDTAVVYYHGGAGAMPLSEDGLLKDLSASNALAHPALIERPVQAQWPFYTDFDGTADNTFDAIPSRAEGASWIATRRLSKPGHATELAFTPRVDVEVLVMRTDDGTAPPAALFAAGFADTGEKGRWRDDGMALVPWRLYAKSAAAGERVRVPALGGDYVVLLKASKGVTKTARGS